MSLNEYRAWYTNKLNENPNFCFFEEIVDSYIPVPHKCPVCGKYEFKDYICHDICPYCGWEDDGSENDGEIGANNKTFTDYQTRYKKYVDANLSYKWENDGCP